MIPIIDTHCHIYPDKIAVKAAEATSRFYGIPGSFDGSLSALLRQRQEAGIAHTIINSVATTPKQVRSVTEFIAATVASSGGTMTGLGTLHPDSGDIDGDIDGIIAHGLKGIKLHPDIQGFQLTEPKVMALFEAGQGRLPFLLHLGDKRYDNSNPNRVKQILDAFPDLQIVGAHFAGWSIWEQASRELYRYDRLVVDCSSSMYAIGPEKAAELVRLYGADRVMFGTDFPLMSPKQEVAWFYQMNLTTDEQEKILWKNAAGYYEIEI